jgi:hypothetical protein
LEGVCARDRGPSRRWVCASRAAPARHNPSYLGGGGSWLSGGGRHRVRGVRGILESPHRPSLKARTAPHHWRYRRQQLIQPTFQLVPLCIPCLASLLPRLSSVWAGRAQTTLLCFHIGKHTGMDLARSLLATATTAAARAKELAAQAAAQAAERALSPSSSTADLPSAGTVETSTSLPPVQPLEARVAQFQVELKGACINLHNLKRLAFNGIPDKGNLRATVWKVRARVDCTPHSCAAEHASPSRSADQCLDCRSAAGKALFGSRAHPHTIPSWSPQLLLGYLPPSPEDWPQELATKRTQYHFFCQVHPCSTALSMDSQCQVEPANAHSRQRHSSPSAHCPAALLL